MSEAMQGEGGDAGGSGGVVRQSSSIGQTSIELGGSLQLPSSNPNTGIRRSLLAAHMRSGSDSLAHLCGGAASSLTIPVRNSLESLRTASSCGSQQSLREAIEAEAEVSAEASSSSTKAPARASIQFQLQPPRNEQPAQGPVMFEVGHHNTCPTPTLSYVALLKLQMAAVQAPRQSYRRCISSPAVLQGPVDEASSMDRRRSWARRRASTQVPRGILRTSGEGPSKRKSSHHVNFGLRYSFDMGSSEDNTINVGKRVSAFEEEKRVRKKMQWLEERRMVLGDDADLDLGIEVVGDSDDNESALSDDSPLSRCRARSAPLEDEFELGGRRSRAPAFGFDDEQQSSGDEAPTRRGRQRTLDLVDLNDVVDAAEGTRSASTLGRSRVGTFAPSSRKGSDSDQSGARGQVPSGLSEEDYSVAEDCGGRRGRTQSNFGEDVGTPTEDRRFRSDTTSSAGSQDANWLGQQEVPLGRKRSSYASATSSADTGSMSNPAMLDADLSYRRSRGSSGLENMQDSTIRRTSSGLQSNTVEQVLRPPDGVSSASSSRESAGPNEQAMRKADSSCSATSFFSVVSHDGERSVCEGPEKRRKDEDVDSTEVMVKRGSLQSIGEVSEEEGAEAEESPRRGVGVSEQGDSEQPNQGEENGEAE